KSLRESLNADQGGRLQQIVWQQKGIAAFSDPEVVDKLQLTAEQQEKIKNIQAEGHGRRPHPGGPGGGPGGGRGPGGPPPGGPPPGGPPDWRRPDDPGRGRVEQALRLLAPEQKEKCQALIGEPFKVKLGHG